ncbi:VanZ family protein [Pseudopedobacter beijingensis]|uniref:VanZ family protein n=1 Tax=Pseudopedobacter beijingensis TaxID=1207056 RepID=A0ABW4IBL0_9SPHI
MLKTIKYQLPAIIWSIVVLVLCNVPPSSFQTAPKFFFEGFDKMAHLGFFYVLAVLLFYGKIRQQRSYEYSWLTIIKIVVLTACIGGGIEILQWKVFTYRSAEWWDFFSDMIGVGMAIFSYLLLHRRFNHV